MMIKVVYIPNCRSKNDNKVVYILKGTVSRDRGKDEPMEQ
jgi:hypothetical protein